MHCYMIVTFVVKRFLSKLQRNIDQLKFNESSSHCYFIRTLQTKDICVTQNTDMLQQFLHPNQCLHLALQKVCLSQYKLIEIVAYISMPTMGNAFSCLSIHTLIYMLTYIAQTI